MIELIRSTSKNEDFINLVKQLDAYLNICDGPEHNFYDQFNKIDDLQHVVIAYKNKVAVGCGAFKIHKGNFVEIKRMFVTPKGRRNGVASKVLSELERWATVLNFNKSILETGKQQPEAIELYKSCSYKTTSNFGMYKNIENSVCFEKILK